MSYFGMACPHFALNFLMVGSKRNCCVPGSIKNAEYKFLNWCTEKVFSSSAIHAVIFQHGVLSNTRKKSSTFGGNHFLLMPLVTKLSHAPSYLAKVAGSYNVANQFKSLGLAPFCVYACKTACFNVGPLAGGGCLFACVFCFPPTLLGRLGHKTPSKFSSDPGGWMNSKRRGGVGS